MTAAIRILLVDDHAVVREGYRRLLEANSGIRVIAEAASGEAACEAHALHSPDVTVMDITLPGISGLEALRRIRSREASARILIFSMHEDPAFVTRALDSGARGYLTKASAPESMVRAVQEIAAGRKYVAEALALRLRETRGWSSQSRLDTLTEREFEILRLLAAGHGVDKIACVLRVSSKTVANHQTNIRQKLNCDNGIQLLHVALSCGLAEPRNASH